MKKTAYYWVPSSVTIPVTLKLHCDLSLYGALDGTGTVAIVKAEPEVLAKIDAVPNVVRAKGLFKPASSFPRGLLNIAYGVGVNPPATDYGLDLVNKLIIAKCGVDLGLDSDLT
jgi:hypothetical protein